jgi:two-component system, NtrC family, sensor kinase
VTENLAAFVEQYASALADFLVTGGEEARSRAYDIGRRAVAHRLGLLRLAEIHHYALEEVMHRSGDRHPDVASASNFLAEVLSPFEMSLRGFQEANGRLVDLNEALKHQNVVLVETARSEREAHEARKRAESQLVQSEKLAALGLLVAGVAHEINNPLAFVLGNMAVLARDVRFVQESCDLYRRGDEVLNEHAPELAAAIAAFDARVDLAHTIAALGKNLGRSVEGLERIRQIVRDLSDFARPEETPGDAVDVNHGVELTVRLVRPKAAKKGVELALERASLPAVACHAVKINQVVLNLLVNAIDACEAGGRVEVRTRPLQDGVAIEVSDTGCGVDPGIRSRIFDPFFTTKPVGQGMGLGLAISQSIVQAHGGVIEFEPRPGGGTRFSVQLPASPPAQAPRDKRLKGGEE